MPERQTVLVIDDEPDIRELLHITISRMGLTCESAGSVADAIQALKTRTFQLCLTDMNLPDGNGLEIIRHIQQEKPELPVAMITAYASVEDAITAMKYGAFDYISKPVELAELRKLIQSALRAPVIDQRHALGRKLTLIGQSPAITELGSRISRLARSQAPVFISGESGSGKELAARLIHSNSNRFDAPFIAVNCGAIPMELVESELFGHEKGSFTGANEKKQGLFQAADGGTLFLDEIADLPKNTQVKLLRAIQEKSVRPVGANSEVPVNVRIISATHKNLAEEVEHGTFREDLFYRINVIGLRVPSLRERREDIPLLCHHFLQILATRYELPLVSLAPAALSKLEAHEFPGNVRELENILERAFTLCEGQLIQPQDLALVRTTTTGATPIPSPLAPADKDGFPTGIDVQQALGNLDGYLESIEKQILEYALEQTRWNKTAAAELLGISFRAIRHKLKKFGIE
jgi:two-component system response regulator PilR (NtrC family)